MDRPVPINIDLIAKITGLPTNGMKLEEFLDDKTKEKGDCRGGQSTIWH
jgi:hypothetical protein